MTDQRPRPYSMTEQPTSTGRVLLARALSHWCALHDGLSPSEVEAALDDAPEVEPAVGRRVGHAARLIGELIAAGRVRSHARPIGGGAPVEMKPDLWELDDFRPRMANSGLDPVQPFAAGATPTHWIFLDLDDFNELVEASCADLAPARAADRRGHRAATAVRDGVTAPAAGPAAEAPGSERYVRLPEVKRRTGMSRTTIYDRIKAGRFPRTVEMSGNIAAWRESELAEWLANPA